LHDATRQALALALQCGTTTFDWCLVLCPTRPVTTLQQAFGQVVWQGKPPGWNQSWSTAKKCSRRSPHDQSHFTEIRCPETSGQREEVPWRPSTQTTHPLTPDPSRKAVTAGGWIFVSALFGAGATTHAIPEEAAGEPASCSTT
jgi:hypothetical protein